MTITAVSVNPRPKPRLFWRLAAATWRWALPRRRNETAAVNGDRNCEAGGVIGAKKCAVFVDRRGHLRVIELLLPTDVLADMQQPIEIRFLEGEEGIRSDQLKSGISKNFLGFQ
jgi:hypothetical protein